MGGLKKLVIDEQSGFKMPISRIRQNPKEALAALRSMALFTPKGPWREELLFMGDLLRKNRDCQVTQKTEAETGNAVTKMLQVAHTVKLQNSKKKGKQGATGVSKSTWAAQLTDWLAHGDLRRGHLQCLINAEALRDVGYEVGELRETGFSLLELRLGGYTAAEMRAEGLKAGALAEVGYVPAQLREGGYSARELKPVFTAQEIRTGGFTMKQLRTATYTAAELKEEGFTPTDMRQGTYLAKELKPLGYTASELRIAGCAPVLPAPVAVALWCTTKRQRPARPCACGCYW